MKTKCKRLLSLLLVFVLVLGLMPSVYAATDEGTQPTTEPAVTEAATEPVGDTEPTVPETTGATEATDPSESTEGTQATEAPTEAEEEETEALPPAAIRFNEFYETLAERLLSWAEGTLRTEAMADFAEEGRGAVYRFDRRCLTCDMTARLSPSETAGAAPTALVVTRALAFTSRRGSVRERCLSAADVWRWPELTLRPPKRRTEKAAPPARDVE